MKRFFFDCGTRDLTASLGIAFLRIAIGSMMIFGHGWMKLTKWGDPNFTFPVPEIFPFNALSSPVSHALAISAEVGAAALLILGLATRPAAFILGFTMTVAAFHVHAADLFAVKETALLYLIPCVALILTGGGSLSLDAGIFKERRRNW